MVVAWGADQAVTGLARRGGDPMGLTAGNYTIGPADGTLLIKTAREGAAARMGHDLTLEATRWSATVVVDADDPTRSSVSAAVDAASLEVRDARGGAIALTDKQRVEIGTNIRDKVLHTSRHPEISFLSTLIAGDATAATVTGDLTVAGSTRPVQLRFTAHSHADRVTGTATVVQTDHGIKPYSAMLGALKVKDAVEIEVDVRLPAGR
jgi:polyisoprenoid-binding protein YceI